MLEAWACFGVSKLNPPAECALAGGMYVLSNRALMAPATSTDRTTNSFMSNNPNRKIWLIIHNMMSDCINRANSTDDSHRRCWWFYSESAPFMKTAEHRKRAVTSPRISHSLTIGEEEKKNTHNSTERIHLSCYNWLSCARFSSCYVVGALVELQQSDGSFFFECLRDLARSAQWRDSGFFFFLHLWIKRN